MNTFTQIGPLWAFLLSMHRRRPGDTLLMGAGFSIATAALAVMLAIPAGIDRIAGQTGQPDIALALSNGALDEAGSSLSPEQVAVVSHLPSVGRDANGRPRAAPQFLANAKLSRTDGQTSPVLLRGISADTWAMIDPTRIDVAIKPREGARELAASATLQAQFPELARSHVDIQESSWRRTSELRAAGNLWESELWTDLSALQAAYNRPGRVSSLWLKLDSPDVLPALRAAAADDPRLQGVRILSQVEYYEQQVGFLTRLARSAALGVSLLLGAGAILAISTTLGMVLERRRREMATLRALGFSDTAVGTALLLDLLAIGALASLATFGIVHVFLDGASFGTSSVNQAVYARFVVDAEVMTAVLGYALLVGLASAAMPLHKVMSGRLVDALRE